MPRSQASALKRLTTLFLSLSHDQQVAAMDVFAAIANQPVVTTPTTTTGVAAPAKIKRRPRRKVTPVASPVDTE